MNSNLNEVTSLFDQKEQELRQLAAQRAKQLEAMLIQKEKKLKEQDLIIRAQMEKISQLQHEVADKEHTCQEYEQRFQLLKDAVDQQSRGHANELEAQKQDLLEWVTKYQLLEEKLQNFASERSEILSQLKDAQWAKDQEVKRSQRELQSLQERLNVDKQNYIKQIENVKHEIQDRHFTESQQKVQDSFRTENLLTERITMLEKEINRYQLTTMQQQQVEADLRAKCDILNQKNEKLRLELFNSNDLERKQSIELAMSVQEMKQELETRENFTQRQLNEMQSKLQSTVIEKEKLVLELRQAEERLKHQEILFAEKIQIEVQRVRGLLDRQLQGAHQNATEFVEEKQSLLERIQRLTQQVKDREHESRRELFQLQKRQEETESSLEHQGREFRAQIAMKSKEILNLNEEVHDLTLRLDSRTAELKNCKVTLSKQQLRNDQLQKELEDAQFGAGDIQKRLEDDLNEVYSDQVQQLQAENMRLRQTIQLNQAKNQDAGESYQENSFSPKKEGEVEVEAENIISEHKNTFSDTQQLPKGVFSPILTQQIQQSEDYNIQAAEAQDRQIQALLHHNEMVTNMLNQLTIQHQELKQRHEADQEQVMELRRALFKSQGHMKQHASIDSTFQIGSVDITRPNKGDQILGMNDKVEVLNGEIKRLQSENISLKTKLVEQDRLVKQLKQERDQLLDISQSLKVKLSHSEKKLEIVNSADKVRPDSTNQINERLRGEPATQNELNYLNAVIQHLRQSQQNIIDGGEYNQSPLEPEFIRQSNSQNNLPRIQQLLNQRLSDIPGFENFQPNMQMFEQSMLSVLSEHLKQSKGYTGVSPVQPSGSNVRKSVGSAWSNNYSHGRNDSDINDSSASDYTKQPKSQSQLRNQTFGQNSIAVVTPSNQDMLSPGMQEEGIANIAITSNFVQKVKLAAKARLQELKQTYIMEKANDIFPVKDEPQID